MADPKIIQAADSDSRLVDALADRLHVIAARDCGLTSEAVGVLVTADLPNLVAKAVRHFIAEHEGDCFTSGVEVIPGVDNVPVAD